MYYDMEQRRAGVLLHPTSLPSGTLDDAPAWLEFMHQAGLSIWQVLPLGVPQVDRSPYQCLSAFATNPDLLAHVPEPTFQDDGFRAYCEQQAHWLDDYALFMVLKNLYDGAPWYQWPQALKWREPQALQAIRKSAAHAVQQIQWEQYHLHRYWQSLRQRAHRHGIHLFGDMPIFVAHDSADVWACPQRFLLDDQGQPQWVAGVPPDYFSATGQRWGNPHYDWDYHQNEGFRWWLERLKHHFQWFDLIRIDHFRGLEAVWMIDAQAETAIDGHWQTVPGDALLSKLQDSLGRLPLVAEDLGMITDAVRQLKAKYRLPGMAILQFAFDGFDDNPHKPQNIGPHTVVYTGTHDNDTTRGWFDSLSADMQAHVRAALGIGPRDDVVNAMIHTAFASQGNLAIIPLQDFLGLGSEARMNTPGTTEGNWRWQFQWHQLEDARLRTWIRQQVEYTNRGAEA